MIFAFSTSSRMASVAVLSVDGEILWSGEKDAPQSASSACFELLQEARQTRGLEPKHAELFVSDVGPGSFTGVRVGIVLAKTLGFVYGKPCAGVSAFDLISTESTVVLPLKRGEFFVREPGMAVSRSAEPPAGSVGYGPGVAEQRFPSASRCASFVSRLVRVSAEELVPSYLLEPSISVPKKPFVGTTP